MLSQPLPPVKFLIVDDREENLYALAQILRRDGLELVAARSGAAALEQLLLHDFALAVIDVQMPEMDGVELAELMRGTERTQAVPIILVTAGKEERSRLFRGYEAGAVDFLYKPIEPMVLRNKAETFFELYRQKQQLAQQLERLRASEEKLAETLRLNELFVAVVGHDLRNPLQAIITGSQLIARRSTDTEAVRLAETMRDGGRRMQRMTGALFDLTRARLAGGIPITPTRCDLRPLAERVFEEHKLAAPSRRLTLGIRGNVEGEWDPTRVEQLLSNLLGNAVQHGAPTGSVEVAIHGDAEHAIVLEVRNGGAIPPALLGQLFDPFRRREDGLSDGLGLGLFIVQQIALAHRGHVDVASSEAAGTCFRVQLPRSTAVLSD